MHLGCLVPADIDNTINWRTFIVEIGHARRWGTTPGSLDWKDQQLVMCATSPNDNT
ncbi:hypothetical protein PHMEG_00011012 [Phytophthora megakarya]|uniref:Uncharacterized protein n=1 Tax=Phytophthora megakarya TaxID=4795 RepID=A0A225WDY8_9STRA|nr:hypothetical protein PHMEG_00011012 [Phytophthora megakarya]